MKTNPQLIRVYAILPFIRLRRMVMRWVGDLRGILLKSNSIDTDIGSGMAEAIQESIEQSFGKSELKGPLALGRATYRNRALSTKIRDSIRAIRL